MCNCQARERIAVPATHCSFVELFSAALLLHPMTRQARERLGCLIWSFCRCERFFEPRGEGRHGPVPDHLHDDHEWFEDHGDGQLELGYALGIMQGAKTVGRKPLKTLENRRD